MQADHLAEMARQTSLRPFSAGETIASANDDVKEFLIVAEGRIEAFLSDVRGRESRLGVVEPGETIGEVSIMEGTTRPVRFTAVTDGSLLATSAETFRSWLNRYPALMRNLFRTLSTRFKNALGIKPRDLPARRLGVVAISPRAWTLAARLAAHLCSGGEWWRACADRTESLLATGCWPEAIALEVRGAGESPFKQPSPEVDRHVVIWTTEPDAAGLAFCDEILWLVDAAEASTASRRLREFGESAVGAADRVRIVWLLDKSTPVAPIVSGWNWSKPAIKVHVESNGGGLSREERQGLDRLTRALKGYRIGLALAGGGAKGMAHLGVLRAFDEAGLSFDVMSGTSAGAMAGIMYASGMPPAEAIENFQRDLTPGRWFRTLPKWPNWYLLSQFRRLAWDRMLRRYLHDWRLEQLPIPFHSVTVDLVQVRPVVRDQGDAVHAILESINLPVVSRPILRDGMVLVDGGVLNNLPADVLADRGADFVIGVDVASRVRHEFGGNKPETATEAMKRVGALDTLFRIFEAQAHNLGNIRNRAVDFWITPDTSRFPLAEFHRTKEIAASGEAAAVDKLAELKQRLTQLEQRLCQSTPRNAAS
jgi:predicted acylesterase/phospholipase RssA/CRP-like cAMP-binding protein